MKRTKNLLLAGNSQQNLMVLCFSVLALTACVLTGSIIFSVSRSKAADAKSPYKYYTSVEIERGDTLWSIASEYMTEEYDNLQEYVTEVKVLNGLGDDEIHSGQFLIVPYYSYDLK